jgi:hypothetical protein
MRRSLLLSALLLAMLMAAATSAFAGTRVDSGMTITTPDTYGSCTATSDTISVTGVGTRYLKGWAAVEYVLAAGERQLVNFYSVAQVGDLLLTVQYPPASQWPVADPATGVGEIHVDLAIEVYPSALSAQYGWDKITTLGPGNDWDVYCNTPGAGTPGSGTPRTIGYWKTHPSAWPVTTLNLGCGTVDQATALKILKTATAKDMTSMLAAQLIAAELNVASGASTSIQVTIDQANAFLCQYPIGSNPQADARLLGEALKNTLDAYNNSQGG